MWRTSVAAIAFFAAAQAAQAEGSHPFAPPGESFWRSARGDFGPDAAFLTAGTSLQVRTPCFGSGLAFETVAGRARFNNQFGSWHSQEPGCAALETQFDAAEQKLRETAEFRLDGGRLALEDMSGHEIASLERIVPDGLEYRAWTITAYRRGAKRVKVLSFGGGQTPRITFFNGELLGTPGCGGLVGSYSRLGDGRLKLFAAWMLVGLCADMDRVEAQNNAITRSLTGKLMPQADGPGRFLLRDGRGRVRIELTAIKGEPQ